ncbi:MAG: carbohydrate ABC transporter permease [Kouleothrix sp.]|jgi:multiple sugar transport system permease protein|nr:carbohydrate ABC transporter permease [Kouleothrix sp.]
MATNASALTIAGQRKKRLSIGRILAWAGLCFAIVVVLIPFYWVVRTALATKTELYANPAQITPPGFTFENFARVLGQVSAADAIAAGGSGQTLHFWLYLRNSVIVTGLTVVGQVFFSALAAYAFARLYFPLRDKIFFLYIIALMIPGIVTLIPNYIMIRNLNWLNTFQGIVAPAFLMSPFAVFFLRQFFLGINREVEEAAKIDGASLFSIFWKIILPVSGPPLATLGILTWIGTWNEYLWPLLIGPDEQVRVLTVALGVFRSQTPQGAPDWGGLMAGAVLSILPSIALFLILGRKAINSIQFSGYK